MRHKGNVMERRIRLKSVNPYVTCSLCKGYLIDATTITECLHTFCKSCIVRYLEEKHSCPKCGIVIHQSHPLNYISHDRTMQDIVMKLVPHLAEEERKRQIEFYKSKGMEVPAEVIGADPDKPVDSKTDKSHCSSSAETEEKDYHRSDEQVNVYLECGVHNMKVLKRQYLRTSCHTTITHLKKFLAFKLYNNIDKFKEIELLCNQEILGKDHTLKFVCVTRWRFKDIPLKINYRHKLHL